jgi:hypothetical protein
MSKSVLPSVIRVFPLFLAVSVFWCCAGTSCPATDNQGNDLVDDGNQNGTDGTNNGSNQSNDQTRAVPGDMNGDGAVNMADAGGFQVAYQEAFGADKSQGNPKYNGKVDMDGNGIIDFRDLQLFDVVVPDAIQ